MSCILGLAAVLNDETVSRSPECSSHSGEHAGRSISRPEVGSLVFILMTRNQEANGRDRAALQYRWVSKLREKINTEAAKKTGTGVTNLPGSR